MFFSYQDHSKNGQLNKPFFLGLLGLLCAIYAFSPLSAKPGPRATPVVISIASEQWLAPTILVPGTLVSKQQSALPAEVEGRLTWVANIGDKLKMGDIVARLDQTLYELQTAENKANLKRELVRLDYLEKEVVRLEALIKGNFSSKNTLDKMLLDRDVAKSDVVIARAKIKINEAMLRRYKIHAPFDGVIIERTKREGEWTHVGDTVVTLANPDSLEIDARVSDKSIDFIHLGDQLNLYRQGEKAQGEVKAIVRIGDKQSHLFTIKIDMPNQGWLAGQAIRVEVPIGKTQKLLAVPRDALVLRRNGNSIYRINDDNKSEQIRIITGVASEEFMSIKGNVQAGDKIVIRGGERLRPGQTVKIIPGKSQ